MYVPGGGIMLNPDGEVQARIRLVFENFVRLGSAKAVVRYLREAALALPVRPSLKQAMMASASGPVPPPLNPERDKPNS